MIGTAPATDEALVLAYARGGDRRALEKLVERHFGAAYRLAVRTLGDPGAAEDAAEEAFIHLIRGARRFTEGRAFAPWFTTFVLNAVRNSSRARRRRERHERIAAERRPRFTTEGLASLERADVDAHVLELPLDVRLPIVLHYYEGHSHEEVAELVGCPRGTAASRIRRGLEQLRDSLAAGGFGAVMIGTLSGILEGPAESLALPRGPSVAALEAAAAKTTTAALLVKAGLLAVVFAASIGGASAVLHDPEPATPPGTKPLVAKTGPAPEIPPLLPPPTLDPPPPPAALPVATPAPVSAPPPPAPAPASPPLLAGPGEAASSRGLGWRVKFRDTTVYLVASPRYADDSLWPLPDAIEEAFRQSGRLVVATNDETTTPEKLQSLVLELGTYPPSDSIEQHVGAGTYKRVLDECEGLELPIAAAGLMKPWLLALTLEQLRAKKLGYTREKSLEAHFLKEAREKKLKIVELTSAIREVKDVHDLFEGQQEQLLASVLADESARRNLPALMAAWKAGDTAMVETYVCGDIGSPEIAAVHEKLVTAKCKEWASRIGKLGREKDPSFVVLGATYLVGEKGIVKLLEEELKPLSIERLDAKSLEARPGKSAQGR